MTILFYKLDINSEGTRLRLLWTMKSVTTKLLLFSIISFLTKKLTFCAQTSSSGPLFCTGVIGRIPVTLKISFESSDKETTWCNKLRVSLQKPWLSDISLESLMMSQKSLHLKDV